MLKRQSNQHDRLVTIFKYEYTHFATKYALAGKAAKTIFMKRFMYMQCCTECDFQCMAQYFRLAARDLVFSPRGGKERSRKP